MPPIRINFNESGDIFEIYLYLNSLKRWMI